MSAEVEKIVMPAAPAQWWRLMARAVLVRAPLRPLSRHSGLSGIGFRLTVPFAGIGSTATWRGAG
jgi:hypothetical protein